MRYAAPLLALALLLLPGTAPAQGSLGQELLGLINAERRSAGAPPLRHSPALSRVADWHAGEIARQGSLRLPPGSRDDLRDQMKRAGYQAHKWTESLATTTGDPETVLRNWRRSDPGTFRELMDPQARDIGFGFGRLKGTPLYVVLFAEPQADYIVRETMDLRDLAAVRQQIVASANAYRRKAGLQPLKANARLDQAAQRHAADMLARNFFAHRSPDGDSVRERAEQANYDWRTVGENIAEGQLSVQEVMATWMNSPGHRKNILNPAFKELGVGLAMGKSGGTYRVIWAQAFGAR